MCVEQIELQDNYYACRQCDACRQLRANEWSFRVVAEMVESDVTKQGICLLLTFSDEYNQKFLSTEYVKRFMKRLRKRFQDKQKNAIYKVMVAGEYGTKTKRPHYHIIILGTINIKDKYSIEKTKNGTKLFMSDELAKCWKYGRVTFSEMNIKDSATVAYVARYAGKQSNKLLPYPLYYYPEFNTFSKNLGKEYVRRRYPTLIENGVISLLGKEYKIMPFMARMLKEELDIAWCWERNIAVKAGTQLMFKKEKCVHKDADAKYRVLNKAMKYNSTRSI